MADSRDGTTWNSRHRMRWPDGNRVFLGDDPAAIDVARLDLADADDVGAELEGLVLQVTRGFGG